MSWTRVRGHDALAAAFGQVMRTGRLAHAYLFVGPEGIGKKLFAQELAKALLCEAPDAAQRLNACDACPGCLQVEANSHPDCQSVALPEDKHEFPLSIMQDLTRRLSIKPARGRHRVAIVDDADQLNDESANAFLKTLEEPPPRSLLILIGTRADRQLPTILSRCQTIRFAPLAQETVAVRLLAEGLAADAQAALQLAAASGGSLGDARLLADEAVARFRRELFESLSQPRVSSVVLAEKVVRFSEEAGKESAAKRQRARLAIRFIIDLLRGALLVQSGQAPTLAEAADRTATQRLAERVSEDRLLEALERALRADYQVERRIQLVLILEAVMDALGQQLQAASA